MNGHGRNANTEVEQPEALTCIHPRIHSAAPVADGDSLESIEVEAFLDALVEVAFAVASRQTGKKVEERQR